MLVWETQFFAGFSVSPEPPRAPLNAETVIFNIFLGKDNLTVIFCPTLNIELKNRCDILYEALPGYRWHTGRQSSELFKLYIKIFQNEIIPYSTEI